VDSADRVQPRRRVPHLVTARDRASRCLHGQDVGAAPVGLRLRRLRERGFLTPSLALSAWVCAAGAGAVA
jgi:hypothetical protein